MPFLTAYLNLHPPCREVTEYWPRLRPCGVLQKKNHVFSSLLPAISSLSGGLAAA